MHTRRATLAMPIETSAVCPQAVSELELTGLRNLLRRAADAANASNAFAPADATDPRWRSALVPYGPVPAADYFRSVAGAIVPAAAPVASPLCLAHMSSLVPDVLGPIAELVAVLNQNMVKRDASGVFTLLERQTLAALHRLVYGAPDEFYDTHVQSERSTLGIVTSGGTASNLTALWIARNRALGPDGGFHGVEREGLAAALAHYGCTRAVIVGSTLLHYSFDKAASVLGLGSDACVKVPVDAKRHIDLEALRRALEECRRRRECVIAVVGIAGATDCGAVDTLDRMADCAGDFGVQFHVDAAWGGPLLFSKRYASKLQGIERADSVTFDGHKQVHLPVGTGFLLLRDPSAAAVIEKTARYMLQEESGDLGRRSLEGSRPATALLMHAALHLIGQSGFERLVDESVARARYLAREIERRDEFELLAAPETNIVLYRFLPPGLTRAARATLTMSDQAAIDELNERLQREEAGLAGARVSRTLVDYQSADGCAPVTALRAVLGNPKTTERDILTVLDEQRAIGERLAARIV